MLPGEGNEDKMLEPSEGAVLAPQFILPVKSATPEHRSMHPPQSCWEVNNASSEKCQGKAEAARQQRYEQCLISALGGLLLI